MRAPSSSRADLRACPLGARLTRRGVAPSAALLALLLAESGAQAAVCRFLIDRTAQAAVAYAAGLVLEGVHGVFRLKGEPRMTRFLARELATAHWFDLTAARRDLGYAPRVSIDEGMRRLAEWLRR